MKRLVILLLLLLLSIAQASAETQRASDTFSGGDSNPISSPWVGVINNLQVLGGDVRGTTAGVRNSARYGGVTLKADGYTQGTLTSASGDNCGVSYRNATGAQTYYLGLALPGITEARITKYVGGGETTVATVSQSWSANDTIRLEVFGSHLSLYRNGSLILSATDTAITAAGESGIHVDGNTGSCEVDNWSTGDFEWQSNGTLGTASSSSADQSSLALTTTAACESGNVCACVVAVDNNGTTDGDEGAVTSITDSASNTWTKLVEFTNGQGTAQTGATSYLGYTTAASTIASSGTITANFSNSTSRDASAMTCWAFSVPSGYTISTAGTATLANDGADPGAITISSLASSEYLWLHGLAAEGPTTDGYTWASNYSQFSTAGTTPATGLTQTRAPTADEAESGTWSGGTSTTRYTIVDDHDDSSCADILTAGTAASDKTFTGTAFSVPTGSTITQIDVIYRDGKTGSPSTTVRGRLKVNGTYYANGTTHNATNGGCNLRTDTWTTNPNTTAAWTVADVNGSGAAPLQAFGFGCSDCSPTVTFGSIQLKVTYDEPPDTGMHVRGGFRIFTGTTDTVDVTSTTADRDYAQVMAALLATAPVGGGPTSRTLTLMGVGR